MVSYLYCIITCGVAHLHCIHSVDMGQTNIEISAETDFNRILQIEEEQVQKMCEDIIALKPDLVFTEKGVSGTETDTHHFLSRAHAPASLLDRVPFSLFSC